MADFTFKDQYSIDDLLRIMEILRSENGCPWDREQTHESIRKNMIEETYEVVEAIDKQDPALLREELGDVLLQVVFHSRMEEEAGRFTFDDVANDICQKLIERHPHIFGDVVADNSDQVLKNWDAIKKQQKHQKTYTQTLEDVPAVLPALMRASKVQQRAARAGFDYPDLSGALEDLKSEVVELTDAITQNDSQNAEEELGDILFAAVNVSRFLKTDAEETLTRSTEKFIRRFKKVEELAAARKIDMKSAGIDTLNELWKQAKQD